MAHSVDCAESSRFPLLVALKTTARRRCQTPLLNCKEFDERGHHITMAHKRVQNILPLWNGFHKLKIPSNRGVTIQSEECRLPPCKKTAKPWIGCTKMYWLSIRPDRGETSGSIVYAG